MLGLAWGEAHRSVHVADRISWESWKDDGQSTMLYTGLPANE